MLWSDRKCNNMTQAESVYMTQFYKFSPEQEPHTTIQYYTILTYVRKAFIENFNAGLFKNTRNSGMRTAENSSGWK